MNPQNYLLIIIKKLTCSKSDIFCFSQITIAMNNDKSVSAN